MYLGLWGNTFPNLIGSSCDQAAERKKKKIYPSALRAMLAGLSPFHINSLPCQSSSYVCLVKLSSGQLLHMFLYPIYWLFDMHVSFLTMLHFYEVGTCQQGKRKYFMHLIQLLSHLQLGDRNRAGILLSGCLFLHKVSVIDTCSKFTTYSCSSTK